MAHHTPIIDLKINQPLNSTSSASHPDMYQAHGYQKKTNEKGRKFIKFFHHKEQQLIESWIKSM